MNITFITERLSNVGGTRMVLALSDGLVQNGHRVTVIAPRSTIATTFTTTANLIVSPVNYAKLTGLALGSFLLRNYLKRTEIAVTTYYPTAFALHLATVNNKFMRKFYFAQSYDPSFPEGRLFIVKKKIAQLSYSLPFEYISNSKWLKQLLLAKHNCLSHIVNPGVDTKLFRPHEAKPTQPKKVILTIGRLQQLKGLSDFLTLVKVLKQRGCLIDPVIVTQERIEGIRCASIVKPRNDEELARLYSIAHLYVHTSYSEGFGLAPLEAMACGTPAIITNSGGVTEYAQHGVNSIIVEPGDISAMSEAVLQLTQNRSRYRKLQASGIKTARSFSWQKTVENFEKAIQNHAHPRSRGSNKT